jgi:hypothetical protein
VRLGKSGPSRCFQVNHSVLILRGSFDKQELLGVTVPPSPGNSIHIANDAAAQQGIAAFVLYSPFGYACINHHPICTRTFGFRKSQTRGIYFMLAGVF